MIFLFCFVVFCVLSVCRLVIFCVLSVYCLFVRYLECGMWFEVMYLYVGSGWRDRNYFLCSPISLLHVCVSQVFLNTCMRVFGGIGRGVFFGLFMVSACCWRCTYVCLCMCMYIYLHTHACGCTYALV